MSSEDKKDILERVKQMSFQKIITKNELLNAYHDGVSLQTRELTIFRKVTPSEIFYFLGGLVVFLGLAILVSQNWDALPSFLRIFLTLGIGIITLVFGLTFVKKEKLFSLSQTMFLISELILPIGMAVFLNTWNLSLSFDSLGSITFIVIFLILSLLNIILYKVFSYLLFFFFILSSATFCFLSICLYIIATFFVNSFSLDPYAISFLLLGSIYLAAGTFISKTNKVIFTPFLYSLGSICILTSLLILGGASPNQNIFLELLYPIICFLFIAISIRLQTKVFLLCGTAFLMVFILKITSEYFSQGFGWPIALILSGVILMCIGYGSFFVNKNYLKKI